MKKTMKASVRKCMAAILTVCSMGALLILPGKLGGALTADAAYAKGTYTLECQSANVRKEPGEGIVGYIANGSAFTVSEIDGKWGYSTNIPGTSGKTLSGWVSLENCELQEEAVSSGNTPSNSADTDAPVVSDTSAAGASVKITAVQAVNMRSGAGMTYEIVGWVPSGTTVTISDKSGSWYKVTYQDRTGWIHSANTENVSGASGNTESTEDSFEDDGPSSASGEISVTAAMAVNLRSGPGTGYETIGWIKNGIVLSYTDNQYGWLKVTYNGKTGWISSVYTKLSGGTVSGVQNAPSSNTSMGFGSSSTNDGYSRVPVGINNTGVKLDFWDSFEYAKKYWNTPNPAYEYHARVNCCNFTSQVLVAGGLPTSFYWADGEVAFINIKKCVQYMQSTHGIDYILSPTLSQVETGDMVLTDDGGHIMFCTLKNRAGVIYASGNTNNRDSMQLPIDDIYAVLKTSEFYK